MPVYVKNLAAHHHHPWFPITFVSMSIMKKLAGETIYYGISSIFGRFINFFLTPIYTYSVIIDKAKMGHLTELMAYTAIILILFTCRMEAAYFRFGKDKDNQEAAYRNSVTTVVSLSVLFGLLLFMLSPIIAPVLDYGGEHIYFQLLAVIMTIDAFCELPLSRLRFEGKAKKFAFIRIINILTNVCFNIFFVVVCPRLYDAGYSFVTAWFDPEKIIVYIFLSQVFGSLSSLILLSKYLKGVGRVDIPLLKRMVAYSWPLIIVSLVSMFNEMFGRVILKWFLTGSLSDNEAQLGVYGANYRLATIIALFTQAFRYAAEPFFFKESNNVGAEKTYADVTKYYLIFSIYGFLFVSLYIDIFKYFVGPKYFEGLKVVPILLLANVFNGLYFNVSIWYRLKDKTLTGAMIAIFGAVLTLFFNWYLIPVFGYIGSAIATLVCYSSMTIICFVLGQKVMKVPYQVRTMLLWMGAAILIQIGIWYLRSLDISVYLVLLCSTIGIVLFSGLIWSYEKEKIKTLLRSIKLRSR